MARDVWDGVELWSLDRMGTMALIRSITGVGKLLLGVFIAMKILY